jgi:hypothetical protein
VSGVHMSFMRYSEPAAICGARGIPCNIKTTEQKQAS